MPFGYRRSKCCWIVKWCSRGGYSFGGWWKDGVKVSDDVNFSVTVDATKTYIAKFIQDPYLNLDKTSLEFEAAGGTQTVNVTSNVEWTVS